MLNTAVLQSVIGGKFTLTAISIGVSRGWHAHILPWHGLLGHHCGGLAIVNAREAW